MFHKLSKQKNKKDWINVDKNFCWKIDQKSLTQVNFKLIEKILARY